MNDSTPRCKRLQRPLPSGHDGPVVSRSIRLVLPVATMVVLAAGCGSGEGDPSSSGSRPTLAPIASERPDRPEVTQAPGGDSAAPILPPVTEAPIPPPATEAPATAAPVPATTTPAPASDDDSTTWWPWLLVALAVVGGVIALVRRRPKSAATPPPGPVIQTADVLDQSDQITTHLVALAPGSVSSVAGADASRVAALLATVEQLMRSNPDEASRSALGALYPSMRSLHAALDAIALAPLPLADADVAELKARATALHTETALARATLFPPPATPPPTPR